MNLPCSAPPLPEFSLLPRDEVEVPFNGKVYRAVEWTPDLPVPFRGCRALSLDTETKLLVKGEPVVPAIVQVTATDSDLVVFARPRHFPALLRELDTANPSAQWVFFNGPFDAKVLGWPADPLWRLFAEGRFVDMEVRGVLHKLAAGTYLDKLNLDMLSFELLGVKLCKDEEVRLSFLPDVPLSERQVVYAAQDSLATLGCWERLPDPYPTEDINLKGSFALSAISDFGILLDEDERARLDQAMLDVQISQRNLLKVFGIAPHMKELEDSAKVAGIVDRKQWLLEALEEQYDIKLKRSPKSGRIVTEKKALDLQLIVNEIPVPLWLESSREFDHARKRRSSYLSPGMAGVDGRVHARFTPMVRTGRTACSGPPLQQYPRDPLKDADGNVLGEIRSIWIPTPGFYMLATDYNQLELCALSQSCYERFGKSVMGDLINEGQDVHFWFGNVMGRKKNMDFDPDDKEHPVTADLRQRAKAANFGIPGGLGPATFVAYARNYGVALSLDEAKELIAMWFESFPEMRDHLKSPVDDYWTFRNIKEFLKTSGLEAPHVKTVQDLEDFLATQEWEPEQIRKATSEMTVYMVKTVTGRIKRNCTYCAAANLRFQGLAADGAKLALWEGYLRGWRMVNFIHDEILQEVPAEMPLPQRTLFVREVEDVMVTSMQRVLTRMKVKVDSTLSARWQKKAKPVHDEEGNLLLWLPKEQNGADKLKRMVS